MYVAAFFDGDDVSKDLPRSPAFAMQREDDAQASLPPDSLRRIEESTGIRLDCVTDMLVTAKLDTVGDQPAIELELRIDVSGDVERARAASQLRHLADRLVAGPSTERR